MLDSLLDQLARRRGIGDAYHDYRGELRTFSPATKRAILAAMGCNVTDAGAVEREIAGLDAERWGALLPLVTVLRPGRSGVIVVVPADVLTGWMATVADYNPVTYLLAALRSLILEGWDAGDLLRGLAAVLGVGVVSMSLALAALRGRLSPR